MDFWCREGDALNVFLVKHPLIRPGLSHGAPQVVATTSFRKTFPSRVIRKNSILQASAQASPATVVSAFRRCRGGRPAPVESFQMLPGRGVSSAGRTYNAAGNQKLLIEKQISLDTGSKHSGTYIPRRCTLILTAIDGEFTGFLALSDTLRDNAP